MGTTAQIISLALLAAALTLLADCATSPPLEWQAAKDDCGREMVQRVPPGTPLAVGGEYIAQCMRARGFDRDAYR
jgi:hypothetical protein